MDKILQERLQARLQGNVAVVTGGGTPPGEEMVSFGYAISSALAAAGAEVYVLDRDEDAAQRSVDRITGRGHRAHSLVANVASRDECDAAVAGILAGRGRVDILVNNAAVLGRGSTLEDPDEAFQQTMEVNWMGAVRMARAVLPSMDNRSSIVNIGSVSATHGFGMLDYSSSKGALLSLTYAMAVAYAPRGIRVNAVSPGTMLGTMGRARLEASGADPDDISAEQRSRAKTIPLPREGSGWDIALAVVYLAGPESQWVTGQNLVVDAGWGRVGQPKLD